jgi:Asp-tRNA(Asn)/Glu-tRNA(Gln) amidotransferase A subunit family amidase
VAQTRIRFAQPGLQHFEYRKGISMLAPDEKLKLSPKPYLSATARFKSGDDTPRDFLERCLADLAALEPKIGAFANLNLDGARAAADQSTARWRAGQPRSPIDGMPIGIKDIIETADMPTENGSPLFADFRSERDAASVAALREAGAVIVGKAVTTEFAATEPRGTHNPHDLRRTPGGSSSGSAAAVAAGMVSTALGTQVIGSTIRPASYCGCIGFKVSVGALNRGGSHDGLSQSATGVLAMTLQDSWQVAYEIAVRAGGDPGYPGLFGPASAPPGQKPRRLAFLETAGWAVASPGAKQAMADALARLKAAGIDVLTRQSHAQIAAVEAAIAQARPLSMRINSWESRWPLNSYRNRDASKLSRVMLSRLADAEAMSLEDYRNDLAQRDKTRALYAQLAAECDACVSLSAPAAAPLGLDSTGDPTCTAHASLLGIPAISLPVLEDEGLPLGLQVTGFINGDAQTVAIAAAINPLF